MYDDVNLKVTFDFLTPLDVEAKCCPVYQQDVHVYSGGKDPMKDHSKEDQTQDVSFQDVKFTASTAQGNLNPDKEISLFPRLSSHVECVLKSVEDKFVEITVHINLWKIRKKRVGTFWINYEETYESLYRAVEIWVRLQNIGLFSLCKTTEGYLPIGDALIRRDDIVTPSSSTVLFGNELPMTRDKTAYCFFSYMGEGTGGLYFAAPPLLLAVDISKNLYNSDRRNEWNITPSVISSAAAEEVSLSHTSREKLARKPLLHIVRPDLTTPNIQLHEANPNESILRFIQGYDSSSLPSFGVILAPQSTPYSILNFSDESSCNVSIPVVIGSTRRVDCFLVMDGDSVDDQHHFSGLWFFDIDGV